MVVEILEHVASKPILKILTLLIQEFLRDEREHEHTLSELANLLNYSPVWLYETLQSFANKFQGEKSLPLFRIRGRKRGFRISLNRQDEFVRCLIFFERLKDMGIPAGDIIK